MIRTVMVGLVAGALTVSAAGVKAQQGGKDVVDTAVAAGSVTTLAKALSGDTIAVTAKGGPVMVDNARVGKTDVGASNGIIHVIDTVILPGETK